MAPKLTFTFQRQAWIRDTAVDTAPAEEIDVTDVFLALPAADASQLFKEAVRTSGMASQDTDWFADSLGLLKNLGRDGTGYLLMDKDNFSDFLKGVGIDPVEPMTDTMMGSAREALAGLRAGGGPSHR